MLQAKDIFLPHCVEAGNIISSKHRESRCGYGEIKRGLLHCPYNGAHHRHRNMQLWTPQSQLLVNSVNNLLAISSFNGIKMEYMMNKEIDYMARKGRAIMHPIKVSSEITSLLTTFRYYHWGVPIRSVLVAKL
jgi:hypothetical protein